MTYRAIAIFGYGLLFGIMIALGPYGLDGASNYGRLASPVYVLYVLIALVGSVLIAAKNRRIRDPGVRRRVSLVDLGIIALGLLLLVAIPDSELALRTSILFVVLLAYFLLHVRWMFREGLT